MSVDISKPANQVLADAKKDLANALPTESDKNAAADTLQSALDDHEVKKNGYEDIRQLAVAIRETRKDFIKVASVLVGFDSEKFKDKNGNVIQLGPKWRAYIQQFDETLQFSLEQAANASVMMKSINSVLGAVGPDDGADLKVELEQFMMHLQRKDAESSSIRNKVQELADNVRMFMTEIDVALERDTASIKIELERINDMLKVSRMQLVEINEKIKSLNNATVSLLAPGATATGLAINMLNPVLMFTAAAGSSISAIGTGIALKKAMDERERILREIQEMEHKIADLTGQSGPLKKYKTDLNNIKANLAKISQIAATINIWQTVNMDIHALAEDLEVNLDSNGKMTKFFMKKLSVTKEIYKHFIFLLETYVEQTHAQSA